jgi:hypothetical protein
MGTEFPWRWGRGTISANLDVIWGMSVQCNNEGLSQPRSSAIGKMTQLILRATSQLVDGNTLGVVALNRRCGTEHMAKVGRK